MLFVVIIIIGVIIGLLFSVPNKTKKEEIVVSTKNKESIVFELKGIHEEDEKFFIINFCKENDIVFLEFEPDNIYDPNAIKVLHNGSHIGYVPRFETSEVKEFINKFDYHAFIYKIDFNGGYLYVEIALLEK